MRELLSLARHLQRSLIIVFLIVLNFATLLSIYYTWGREIWSRQKIKLERKEAKDKNAVDTFLTSWLTRVRCMVSYEKFILVKEKKRLAMENEEAGARQSICIVNDFNLAIKDERRCEEGRNKTKQERE